MTAYPPKALRKNIAVHLIRHQETFCNSLHADAHCGMIRAMTGTNPRRNGSGSDYVRFLGIGFAFLMILVVLGTLGFFVDRFLGTLPIFLLVGLGAGFAGGLYYLYRSLDSLGGG